MMYLNLVSIWGFFFAANWINQIEYRCFVCLVWVHWTFKDLCIIFYTFWSRDNITIRAFTDLYVKCFGFNKIENTISFLFDYSSEYYDQQTNTFISKTKNGIISISSIRFYKTLKAWWHGR